MPLKRREWVGPPCLTHGPGCPIRYPACKVEVDPQSDPAQFRCERHGKWCRLEWSVCKRREALYVEPDPVLVAMIADAKEKFRRELAEVTRFEPGSPEFEAADAMFRAAYRQVGRIEAAPGRPEHDAELVATIRRVREVQALGPVAWEELALGVVGVAPGTREHEACRAAIRWEAGRRRREETDRDRGRQDGRARAPRARGEL